jgi:replicative DNA helicase
VTNPPSDELAEQSLLGAIMLEPKLIPEVIDLVDAGDFYYPKHQFIFAAAIDTFSTSNVLDPVSVSTELESRGQLKKVGGAAYLVDLIQTVPMASHARYYAEVVVEKARLRKLAELGVRLQQLAHTEGYGSDDLLGQAQAFFRNIDRPDSHAVKFAEMVTDWYDWDASGEDVIATPWPEVNDWLNGGLAKGRLVTIGGRPSVGKSLGGLNIAAHAAENNRASIFFSLEMSRQEVTTRIFAAGGTADMGELIRRQISEANYERIREYSLRYSGMPLWVDDRERVTVEQIAAKCRSIPDLQVAVVDYLQLVRPSDSRVSREQQVAHISRSLKIMARELGIAVVVAAQLNRGPVREGKPREPTIADLRESGAVEQDSDQVLLLHREEGEDGLVKVICGKNRVGRTGQTDLVFEGKFARLSANTEEYECLAQIGYR